VYYTIDNSPFQKWVVFVASVGFLTDAYDIFALNVVSQILPYVYFDHKSPLPSYVQAALLISTLGGTLVGQVVFGFLADIYGRRKMYGLELIVSKWSSILRLWLSHLGFNCRIHRNGNVF
jgi:MFS transporter, PHS family, inorganic phosphate transporter